VRFAKALHGIVDLGVQGRGHQQDTVSERTLLLLGANRHRDLRDQRLVGQLLMRGQPAADGAGADRDDDVVDREPVDVLDFPDVLQGELGKREPAVGGDPSVERRARRHQFHLSDQPGAPEGALRRRGDPPGRLQARDAAERWHLPYVRKRARHRAEQSQRVTRHPDQAAREHLQLTRAAGARPIGRRRWLAALGGDIQQGAEDLAPDIPSITAWWILVITATRARGRP
jgi:hypothetical protein